MSRHSWILDCRWCGYSIVVGMRGASLGDPGAGVEAANRMEAHIKNTHDRTWSEFITPDPTLAPAGDNETGAHA